MNVVLGISVVILAGIMMGCSIVPIKYATRWKWENIWLLYIGLGQVVFPLLLVYFTVPNAWDIVRASKASVVAAALLFGFGWGVGNVLSGIGYAMLGVGLGLSIVLGLTASAGSLIPLAVLFPERLTSLSALALYAGVTIMLGGLFLSSQAGRLRQAHQPKEEISSGADLQAFGKGRLSVGLIVCVVSGILSSMLNLAFTFGDDIRLTALRLGISSIGAVNTLWLPILIAGFLPTLFYCSYLLVKNGSWHAFWSSRVGSHWLFGILMGLLYIGGLTLYGVGSVRLGEMGAVLDFPVFMSTIVLTGNTAGLVTGEWRGSPRRAYAYGAAGVALLVGSIVVIAFGNRRMG